MRDIHPEQAPYWLGGLIEAISVDGGPTDEQLRLIQALLRGYFGFEEAIDLVPLSPGDLARRIPDPSSRLRLVQSLIVLEFMRHPASEVLTESVERFAAELGIDEPMLKVARRAAEHSRELVMADWSRFRRATPPEPRLTGVEDDEFTRRIDALQRSSPGSLGRAFLDFYDRWSLPLPTSDDAHGIGLVNHDFAHVLTDYLPNSAVDETSLSALITSSTNGDEHFSALVGSLALYEVDLIDFDGIDGTKGVLGRPGAPDVFAEAMRRGAACTHDIVAFDHFAVIDWPLQDVRQTLGVSPRRFWADE